MEKVSYEIAKSEIEKWLDSKRISTKKREGSEDSIEILIYAMVDGDISVNENNEIIHKLKFPVTDTNGNVVMDQLVYKHRIDVASVSAKQTSTKITGTSSVIMPYVSALTGKAIGLLNKLDTEDNRIAQSVAVFFI